MAFATFSGGSFFPAPTTVSSQVWAYAALLMDSANEGLGFVFRPSLSGDISKIHFKMSTITTGAVVDVRLETVGTDGLPSGTLWQSSSNALMTVTDTDDNRWMVATLGSATTVHANSEMAIMTRMSTTSAGNLNFNVFSNWIALANPYYTAFVGNAWSKVASPLPWAIEYSDGKIPCTIGMIPATAISSVAITTASTPDERGMVFSVPAPAVLRGFTAKVTPNSPGSEFVLYDADTTTILEKIYFAFSSKVTAGAANLFRSYLLNTVNLVAGNSYRLTLVPDPGPGNAIVSVVYASNAALAEAFPGARFISETFRTDSGAWTNVANSYPEMQLILDGFDDGVSSGGGSSTSAGVWGF